MRKWSKEKARSWYAAQPWVIGFNYVTSTAINSTDMWQSEFFDEKTIYRELEIAKKYNYNSVRVFLQYIVWEYERDIFLNTLEKFLDIAQLFQMTVLPVLFDDCAMDNYNDNGEYGYNGFKEPFFGKQGEPIFGVFNARWTPSPGAKIADNPEKQVMLREYVHAVVGKFSRDKRILAWDIYNEAGQNNRFVLSLPLLVNAFNWARETQPTQPLTSCVWLYNDDAVFQTCLELSDVISYHDYNKLDKSKEIFEQLKKQERPLFVTEWLCRQLDNTFETHLPLYFNNKIGCFQWGLIPGRTQTNLHWSTMFINGTPDANPVIWQHDVLNSDGTPYQKEEMDLLANILEHN